MEKQRQRILVCICGGLAVLAAWAAPAWAKDALEPIVVKEKLSARDEATIESEVSQRVKKLADAGDDDKARIEARTKLTATTQIKGATQPALNKYAQICGTELAPVASGSKVAPAMDAVQVLVALNNLATSDALARALKSEFSAVRYSAARGLSQLHGALAGAPDECKAVLRALGDAGAAERDELVLRMIYQAVDFSAAANFKNQNDGAEALAKILGRRLGSLSGGSRDEFKDEAAFNAVASCYAKADAQHQRQLMQVMSGLLEHYTLRYFSDETGDDYLPTLRKLVSSSEKCIRDMMKASNVNPPPSQVASSLKGKRNDAAQTQVTKALTELKTLLRGAPWQL